MTTDQPDPAANNAHETGVDRRGFVAGLLTSGIMSQHSEAQAANTTESKQNLRLFSFVGGRIGPWAVTSMQTVVGEPLVQVDRLEIIQGDAAIVPGSHWVLRGVTSNARYTDRSEKESLVKKQAPIGRPTSTHAALIPIRKNAKWWELTQDERRAIFAEQSQHTQVGLKYLPAIARRLHHCRDLTTSEPFDFLTYFDYAKDDEAQFNEMLQAMRASEEWKYVDREIDIRLILSK